MDNLIEKANDAFYAWENKKYEGNSPLSDDDRLLWIEGYMQAYTEILEV